jgi:hypothetical protein
MLMLIMPWMMFAWCKPFPRRILSSSARHHDLCGDGGVNLESHPGLINIILLEQDGVILRPFLMTYSATPPFCELLRYSAHLVILHKTLVAVMCKNSCSIAITLGMYTCMMMKRLLSIMLLTRILITMSFCRSTLCCHSGSIQSCKHNACDIRGCAPQIIGLR